MALVNKADVIKEMKTGLLDLTWLNLAGGTSSFQNGFTYDQQISDTGSPFFIIHQNSSSIKDSDSHSGDVAMEHVFEIDILVDWSQLESTTDDERRSLAMQWVREATDATFVYLVNTQRLVDWGINDTAFNYNFGITDSNNLEANLFGKTISFTLQDSVVFNTP